MVLSDEESGIDGKDLTVRVKRYAVTGLHVTVLVKVGDEVVLNPTNGHEGCGIVRHKVLSVDCTFEHAALLGDRVLRVRDDANPL
jgi:hypothetical protein